MLFLAQNSLGLRVNVDPITFQPSLVANHHIEGRRLIDRAQS
jgi:hypothetical protein